MRHALLIGFIKEKMQQERARGSKTHGFRKSTTIKLCLAGYDDERVKAHTGHSGVERPKKYSE
ncbi:hypothetical protein NBRC116594_14070 [Shimia sp. NS0008-38b]